MKQVTVHIADKDYPFFMELVKKLPIIKKVTAASSPAKKKFLSEMQEAIDELKLIKAGKKKGRNAEDFLNEL